MKRTPKTSRRNRIASDSASGQPLPRVCSRRLFGDSPCVVIEHGREEYRLQITRLGKLILTK